MMVWARPARLTVDPGKADEVFAEHAPSSPIRIFRFTLLRGAEKGLSRGIEDMGLVEVASDDMGLALAAVEIGAHRALQVLS